MKSLRWVVLLMALAGRVHACIWDAESLSHEKARSHDLATAILGETNTVDDPQALQARIKELEANRNETNADWWNNLAGAYLRLNQPEVAVKLLEPVVGSFTNDYGMHANLGTAYHLLGRYAEAEKEIARDLEINPEAHFGLEKYHLALLQYLVRDAKYQARHVYVDEFTASLFRSSGSMFLRPEWGNAEYPSKNLQGETTNITAIEAEWESAKTNLSAYEASELLSQIAVMDPKPAYEAKWNLGTDKSFEAGIIYMTQMNPKEPACFVMLGVAAWQNHDYNLANSAFAKAMALGSGQSELLKQKMDDLQEYIRKSNHSNSGTKAGMAFGFFSLISIIVLLFVVMRVILRAFKRS
jgi:hypothetical protein